MKRKVISLRALALLASSVLVVIPSYFYRCTSAAGAPGPSPAPPACTYSIDTTSACTIADGDEVVVHVTAGAGCAWDATSNASWISFNLGQSGVGNGESDLAIDINKSPAAREGTAVVAGFTVTVDQVGTSSCAFPLSPSSQSFSASGGTSSVLVRFPSACGCGDIVVENALPWVTATVVSAKSTVALSVEANTSSAARSGVINIEGQDFTISQASSCAYSIQPSSQSFGADGGTGTFALSTTSQDCGWSVAPSASWITITSSPTGTGNTTVAYSVAANTSGAARAGTITVSDQSFAVSQDGPGCAYLISPGFQEFAANGGSGTIAVAANNGCDWTASSNADWITVTSTPAGSGNGSVSFSASANQTGVARQGTITVAGKTFTVDEASPGDQADLSVSITGSPKPVATGTRLTYTIVVSNSGPNSATGVSLNIPTPVGTSFASIESPGSVSSPFPGSSGVIQCSLGALSSKGSATITLVSNVLAASGSTLVATPEVTSLTSDPVASNNSVSDITSVVGGGIVSLSWDQPPSTPDDPTPAPTNVAVGVASSSSAASSGASRTIKKNSDSTCSLTGYNIYISSALPVQTTPANLWETVPVTNTTTAPAGPAGSFYVVTSLWNCGGTIVESGGGTSSSGESVGVPAGPTVNSVKVGNKIKASGTGFTGPVQVFIDGVAFAKASSLRSGGALVVQKGSLVDGTTIPGATPAGKTVIITFQNPDGGVGAFSFTAK